MSGFCVYIIDGDGLSKALPEFKAPPKAKGRPGKGGDYQPEADHFRKIHGANIPFVDDKSYETGKRPVGGPPEIHAYHQRDKHEGSRRSDYHAQYEDDWDHPHYGKRDSSFKHPTTGGSAQMGLFGEQKDDKGKTAHSADAKIKPSKKNTRTVKTGKHSTSKLPKRLREAPKKPSKASKSPEKAPAQPKAKQSAPAASKAPPKSKPPKRSKASRNIHRWAGKKIKQMHAPTPAMGPTRSQIAQQTRAWADQQITGHVAKGIRGFGILIISE